MLRIIEPVSTRRGTNTTSHIRIIQTRRSFERHNSSTTIDRVSIELLALSHMRQDAARTQRDRLAWRSRIEYEAVRSFSTAGRTAPSHGLRATPYEPRLLSIPKEFAVAWVVTVVLIVVVLVTDVAVAVVVSVGIGKQLQTE